MNGRRSRVALAAACALTLPSALAAQWRAEAAVAAGTARVSRTVAGAERVTGVPTTGSFAGAVTGTIAARDAWRLELVADGGWEGVRERAGGDARLAARASWSRPGRWGVMLGGGPMTAWRSAGMTLATGAPTSGGIDSTLALTVAPDSTRRTVSTRGSGVTGLLGGWARLGRVTLTATARGASVGGLREQRMESRTEWVDSIQVRQRFDSLENRWRTDTMGVVQVPVTTRDMRERRRLLRQADFSLGASSSFGSLGLSITGGLRRATIDDGGSGWMGASATWALRHDLGLTLVASRLASDALRALPGRQEVRAGIVLRPWGTRATPVALPAASAALARRFVARAERDGRTALVLHAPGARTVEVMADFTAWRVVPMERARDGSWMVRLEVPRGVHRLNVRVDGGEWLPPPGLGVGDDGFGGKVGLLVL